MKQSDVEDVLRLYGAEVKRNYGMKIIASCPFASWTHGGGRDENPSFAAFSSGRGWRYKCMACGESGSMRKMFWKHAEFSKKYNLRVNEIVYRVHKKEKMPLSHLDYQVGGTVVGEPLHHKPAHKRPQASGMSRPMPSGVWREQALLSCPAPLKTLREIPVPVDSIKRFQDVDLPEYVVSRGFDDAHKVWGLGVDEKNRRWVMPVLSREGEMVGYTSRLYWDEGYCFRCGTDIRRPDKPEKNLHKCPRCSQPYVKYKHHPGEWRRNAVFGAHLCEDHRPILIVEGTTDVLRMWTYGVRDAVAILGASPSPGQVQLIAQMTKDVVVMGDGDHAGQLMNQEVEAMFRQHRIPVEKVALDGSDPGDLSFDEARDLLPDRLFGC
jgi:hypothetical protein